MTVMTDFFQGRAARRHNVGGGPGGAHSHESGAEEGQTLTVSMPPAPTGTDTLLHELAYSTVRHAMAGSGNAMPIRG